VKKFTVELELNCGCRIRVRDVPRKNAFLSCDSGLGHGHKVRWVTAKDLVGGRFHLTNNTV